MDTEDLVRSGESLFLNARRDPNATVTLQGERAETSCEDGNWTSRKRDDGLEEYVWRFPPQQGVGEREATLRAFSRVLELLSVNPVEDPFFGDGHNSLGQAIYLGQLTFGVPPLEWAHVVGVGWILRINTPSGFSHEDFVIKSLLPAIIDGKPWMLSEFQDILLRNNRDRIRACVEQWLIVARKEQENSSDDFRPNPTNAHAVDSELLNDAKLKKREKSRGLSVPEAIDAARRHLQRHDWSGQNELAKTIGCLNSTMSEAVKRAPDLQSKRTEYEQKKKRGRERQLSDAMLESFGTDPVAVMDDDVGSDDLLDRLKAKCTNEEQLAELDNYSPDELRKFAADYFTDPTTGKPIDPQTGRTAKTLKPLRRRKER